MWIEIIGLLATLFVLLAFCLDDARHIRLVDIVGAILFVVYGILNHSLSVWLLNLILIFIHIYKLLNNKDNQTK